MSGSITISIVSHGQGQLIVPLLQDLANYENIHEVLLTQNIPEPEIMCPPALSSRIKLIRNNVPKGFAANHNQAFAQCTTPFYAVVNPDIRLAHDPFPALLDTLAQNNCALAVPAVRNPQGLVEDSARYFPTPLRLVAKLLKVRDGRYPLKTGAPVNVDWAAGMFMLFRSESFRAVRGFDDGFFLYYEDVDICVRLWRTGQSVMLQPAVTVTHAAQRASRRRPRYMAWHVSSMLRYFCKHLGRLPKVESGV